MSELGPEQAPQSPENRPLGPFALEFDTGEVLGCHKGNTTAYLHSEFPKADHLFVRLYDENNELVMGRYVFRKQITDFDEVVTRMEQSDWDVRHAKDGMPTEEDMEAYEEFVEVQRKNSEVAEKINAPEITLTQRQENVANFMAYILLTEQLSAQDFIGSGDLFI